MFRASFAEPAAELVINADDQLRRGAPSASCRGLTERAGPLTDARSAYFASCGVRRCFSRTLTRAMPSSLESDEGSSVLSAERTDQLPQRAKRTAVGCIRKFDALDSGFTISDLE